MHVVRSIFGTLPASTSSANRSKEAGSDVTRESRWSTDVLSVMQFSFWPEPVYPRCTALYCYNLAHTSRNLMLSACGSDCMLNTRGLIDFFFCAKLRESMASDDLSRGIFESFSWLSRFFRNVSLETLVFFESCGFSHDFFVLITPFKLSVLRIEPSAELLFMLSRGERPLRRSVLFLTLATAASTDFRTSLPFDS